MLLGEEESLGPRRELRCFSLMGGGQVAGSEGHFTTRSNSSLSTEHGGAPEQPGKPLGAASLPACIALSISECKTSTGALIVDFLSKGLLVRARI